MCPWRAHRRGREVGRSAGLPPYGCRKLRREPLTRCFVSCGGVGARPGDVCTWGLCRPSDTIETPGQSGCKTPQGCRLLTDLLMLGSISVMCCPGTCFPCWLRWVCYTRGSLSGGVEPSSLVTTLSLPVVEGRCVGGVGCWWRCVMVRCLRSSMRVWWLLRLLGDMG